MNIDEVRGIIDAAASPPVPGKPNPMPDPPTDPDDGDEIPDEDDDDEKRRPGRD
jgi:hypothetical protein